MVQDPEAQQATGSNTFRINSRKLRCSFASRVNSSATILRRQVSQQDKVHEEDECARTEYPQERKVER